MATQNVNFDDEQLKEMQELGIYNPKAYGTFSRAVRRGLDLLIEREKTLITAGWVNVTARELLAAEVCTQMPRTMPSCGQFSTWPWPCWIGKGQKGNNHAIPTRW